ncbi:MAG: hypothetical protein R2800_07675 [Flavipsychrobacter sp.]
MNQSFIKRVWQKPPVLFPFVLVFHVLMLAFSTYTFSSEPFPSAGWIQPLWMLLYTISWLFVCDLKRWAAFVYLGLTTLNLMLRFVWADDNSLALYIDTLFPIDVLFTFFVMFYYKKFA